MAKPRLRAVDRLPEPLSLTEAIESGTYLQILEAQRRQMVLDLPDMTGPAKAALHRQIGIHSKEIAALQVEAKQEASESAEVADSAFNSSAI